MDAMTMWLGLSAAVAVLGVGSALAMWLWELIPRRTRARDVLEAGLEQADLALLTGGPARITDARVVDFVAHGHVHATHGTLTVTETVDVFLDSPWETPDRPGRWTIDETHTLVALRDHGRGGIDAVRRETLRWEPRVRFHELAGRGLLVSPGRRKWSGMIVAGPILLGLFLCWVGLISSGERLDDIEIPLAIIFGALLPVSLLAAWVWSWRPGFHGRDPRTRLGRDASALARDRLAATASQADRVALGGFAALTDAHLRGSVQASAPDSRWDAARRFRAATEINALLAVQSVGLGGDFVSDFSGGDAGGD
jgi:uncharacterized protein (TIGR04222 family)